MYQVIVYLIGELKLAVLTLKKRRFAVVLGLVEVSPPKMRFYILHGANLMLQLLIFEGF
jgi:hypothetical protein